MTAGIRARVPGSNTAGIRARVPGSNTAGIMSAIIAPAVKCTMAMTGDGMTVVMPSRRGDIPAMDGCDPKSAARMTGRNSGTDAT